MIHILMLSMLFLLPCCFSQTPSPLLYPLPLAGCPVNSAKCCPTYKGLVCGGDRGNCVSLDQSQFTNCSWLNGFVTSLCQCNDNYYGVACEGCRPGWFGTECNQRKLSARRNFMRATEAERNQFINGLIAMKQYIYWNGFSAYDFMSYLHFVATTEYQPEDPIVNWAHGSSGFPTWHREYLLKFENLARVITKDQSWSLMYWNWTDASSEQAIWDFMGHYDPNCPGISDLNLPCDIISGPFVDWNTLGFSGNMSTTKIQRRVGMSPQASSLPGVDQLVKALGEPYYDLSPFNSSDPTAGSFREYLEGFLPTANKEVVHNMHNQVHLFCGGPQAADPRNFTYPGTMSQVEISASDPIFYLHHTFVDLIFEQWMEEHPDKRYQPASSAPVGHNAEDCMGMFLPLIANVERFHASRYLGYSYDIFSPGKMLVSISVNDSNTMSGKVIYTAATCIDCSIIQQGNPKNLYNVILDGTPSNVTIIERLSGNAPTGYEFQFSLNYGFTDYSLKVLVTSPTGVLSGTTCSTLQQASYCRSREISCSTTNWKATIGFDVC